jgi:hypothetical protein
MFGLNMRSCAVYRINSYDEARAFYEECPTAGGMRDGVHRAIKGKKGSNTMGVRLAGDKVAFRYHSTDVVTWNPDQSYTVDLRWNSTATCRFADVFIPGGHYATRGGYVLVVNDKAYPADTVLTVARCGQVTYSYGARMFQRQTVDGPVARSALKTTGYYDYLTWRNLMLPMMGGKVRVTKPGWNCSTDWVFECVNNPEMWHDLLCSALGAPTQLRKTLLARFAVTGHPVFKLETQHYLDRRANFNAWDVVCQ